MTYIIESDFEDKFQSGNTKATDDLVQ